MSGLGLDTANRSQGFEPIPAGTTVTLVMKIKPGNTGIDNLCKRSSKGDSEGLDVEYTVMGGDHNKRKLYAFHLLDGVTAGQAKAGDITRSLLRAIRLSSIPPRCAAVFAPACRNGRSRHACSGSTRFR